MPRYRADMEGGIKLTDGAEAYDRSSIIDQETGFPRLLADRCATCVFRPGNAMALVPGRLRGMIEKNNSAGTWITCHETLPWGHYPEFGEAICRGYYDTNGGNSWGIRLAQHMARQKGLSGLPEVEPPPDPRK